MVKKHHRNKFMTATLAASLVATAGIAIDAEASTFKDIDQNPNAQAIEKLADQGIIAGFGDETFRPQENLTRGQAARIIVNTLNLETAGSSSFKDVPTSHIFYKEISALNEKGIVAGYGDETFRPDATITRGELAQILSKALDLTVTGTTPFTDIQQSIFKNAIEALYSSGITKGTSATTFSPNSTVTRGEMAAFASRVMDMSFNLTILHTNDTHSRTDIYPKLATAVKAEKDMYPNALLIDAGDVFSGTLYFTKFEGQADAKLMNYIGYDVMTFGNHEFDLGNSEEGHKALANFIKALDFPFISSNVDVTADENLKGLFTDTISSNPEEGKIYQGMVKEINGEKVGFFALTTAETEYISSPVNVKFNDYIETAKSAVKAFENMGINKIVAISHLGYDDNANVDNDLLLAQYVEGIDVIVGGHTHTKLDKPVIVGKDEPTVIVQTGEYLGNLGKVNVSFDENGVVTRANGKLIALDKLAADETATEILEPYKQQVDELNNQEIGVTLKEELSAPRDSNNEGARSIRSNQEIIGNIITDGMLEKAKEAAKRYDKNVVMAFTNGGGIRASINEGPITLGEVRTVLPFGNTLAMMDVTGAEMKAAFEVALKSVPKENGGFLHIAGGYVKFDSSKPTGSRVISVSYKGADGKFIEMNDNETYTVATNFFTAKGGDGFTMFEAAYKEGRVTDFGLSDWENFRDYLISIKDAIPTELEKRIEDVSKGEKPTVDTVAIKEAYKLGAGKQVTVKGTVTAIIGSVVHIEDETGGLALYKLSADVNIGDEVTVNGTLTEYKGLLELDKIEVIEHDKAAKEVVPTTVAGKDVTEANEARLVLVKKVKIVSGGPNNFVAETEDGGKFIVRDTTGTYGIEVGKTYDEITGAIQQFNDDYQVILRNADDLVEDSQKVKSVRTDNSSKLIASGSQISLTTATNGATIYYTTDGSTPTEKSTKYTGPITIDKETTVKAIAVADGFTISDVATFAYKVYDAKVGIRISDIQGEGHESPLNGSEVSNVEGVVTYTYEFNGGYYFHVQSEDDNTDNNPNTSEALIVYAGKNDPKLAVGTLVKLSGKVSEYHIDGSSSKTTTDLTVTQLNVQNGKIEVVKENVQLPKPIKITADKLNHKVIDNDSFSKFDPEEDVIDFWESLEGMRVETGTVRVTAPQEYGEVYAVLDTVKGTTKNGGLLLTSTTASPNLINFRLYNSTASKTVAEQFGAKTGDKFTGPIIGVVNYGYSNYKVFVDYEEMKNAFVEGTVKPETKTSLTFAENKLTVASYNIENFSANKNETTDERVALIAKAIAKGLGGPDIVGLVEVQDADGEVDSGSSDATASFERIIKAIKDAGGPEYKYVNINPENNSGGGAPGANIRPGFLYNPERVTFNAVGDTTQAGEYNNGLTVNPTLVDPTNSAFKSSRKPIAAQFTFQGKEVIVIGNHWNSKSGDLPVWGKTQPVTLSSEVQRVEMAKAVGNFVSSILKKNPTANVIALGDFNDFQWSKPLTTFESYGLYNKINDIPLAERYTYTYQGNSQVLDHILVSNHLKGSTAIDVLNVNADFTETQGRASDHNPVMVQVEFK